MGSTRGSAPYRPAWFAAAMLAVGVLVVSLLVLIGVPRWFPGASDCSVSGGGGRTVGLSTDQAQTASAVAARSVHLRLPLPTASAALASTLDLSESDAAVVASALTGRSAHALTCRHGGSEDTGSARLDRAGLTTRADRVRRDVERAFGAQRLGGFAPGGVSQGHMPGSAHYEGRALDIFFRPVTRAHRIQGWAVAQYLVAQADRLAIATVIFDGHIWTARRGAEGWRTYAPDTTGTSARSAAVLEHRDHVHVDVSA